MLTMHLAKIQIMIIHYKVLPIRDAVIVVTYDMS